jgi:hypothetical protein
MRCLGEEVERLDGALASLAREETALRLRLGQALEVMSRGGFFELGFSSVGAYAIERCERSVRWAEAARCLARRVEQLPGLRGAMAFGKVSWSMGELLARVAQPDDEAHWLEVAESRTVRQVRERVAEAIAAVCSGGVPVVKEHAAAVVVEPAVAARAGDDDETCRAGDEMCTLTCTIDREEAWLFEATRSLLEKLGEHGGEAQAEALLAEAQGTLLAGLPTGTLDPDGWQGGDAAQRRWVSQLERWRAEAEALCEKNFSGFLLESRAQRHGSQARQSSLAIAAAFGMASLEQAGSCELDGHVRALSEGLARHELEFSRRVLRFHRADGWRRLGYATETQYARERLGLSPSSLLARRSLALRLEKLPGVATALGAGWLGVEAALQVVRVATASTEAAWVARARRRTVKHSREEVMAALTAVRLSGEVDCPPPVDAEMDAFHELERAVVSGRVCHPEPADGGNGARPAEPWPADMNRLGKPCTADVSGAAECPADVNRLGDVHGLAEPASEERRAWFVMLGSLAAWLQGGLQMSAGAQVARRHAGSSAGRVALRLRLSRATFAWWRGLEAQARRWLPCGMSWLRFLCLSMWQAWRHLLGTDVAYGHIYVRDRYRCMSPVCNRRDVTPHHLVFRSAGGSDDPLNTCSVCTWCHLCGVHGGRIRARGTAERIRWELGAVSDPCLVVDGRERLVRGVSASGLAA